MDRQTRKQLDDKRSMEQASRLYMPMNRVKDIRQNLEPLEQAVTNRNKLFRLFLRLVRR